MEILIVSPHTLDMRKFHMKSAWDSIYIWNEILDILNKNNKLKQKKNKKQKTKTWFIHGCTLAVACKHWENHVICLPKTFQLFNLSKWGLLWSSLPLPLSLHLILHWVWKLNLLFGIKLPCLMVQYVVVVFVLFCFWNVLEKFRHWFLKS